MSAAIMQMFGNGVWPVRVCVRVRERKSAYAASVCVLWQNVASGSCGIVSSAGREPARRENNAHKRLSEEASGADVSHAALNGAVTTFVCVCVRVLYMVASDTQNREDREKTPS